jgi:peptidoglycan/xylan/chitin deacetylase (PgdA/CDA1 family)
MTPSLLHRALRRLKRRSSPVILMYHRIAQPPVDPWGLAVAPSRFRDQLRVLARHRQILPMDAFVDALEERRLPAEAVAITFDDGYRDNLTHAAPLLDAAAAPATVFLTTGAIGTERPFWWDELARMILLRRPEIRYDLEVGEIRVTGAIPAMAADEAPDPAWRAWHAARTAREAAYVELWQLLQRMRPGERAAAMDALRQSAPPVPGDRDELPMSPEEVAQIVRGRVGIGAHTITHPPLTALATQAECRAEIAGSRSRCLDLSGQPVRGFAFPHGDRDRETMDLVREAGFAWACSTREACVDPGQYDRFDLPRLVAPDVSGRALMKLIEEATP